MLETMACALMQVRKFEAYLALFEGNNIELQIATQKLQDQRQLKCTRSCSVRPTYFELHSFICPDSVQYQSCRAINVISAF